MTITAKDKISKDDVRAIVGVVVIVGVAGFSGAIGVWLAVQSDASVPSTSSIFSGSTMTDSIHMFQTDACNLTDSALLAKVIAGAYSAAQSAGIDTSNYPNQSSVLSEAKPRGLLYVGCRSS